MAFCCADQGSMAACDPSLLSARFRRPFFPSAPLLPRTPHRPALLKLSPPRSQVQNEGLDVQRDKPDQNPNPPVSSTKNVSAAFAKAAAYRKSLQKVSPASQKTTEMPPTDGTGASLSEGSSQNSTPLPDPMESSALLKDLSPDFKSRSTVQSAEMASALQETSMENDSSQTVEVEIVTRDGIIKRKVSNRPDDYTAKFKELKRTGISSSDFIGLDFSEKKFSSKGAKPAGLAVGLDAPPPGSLPEVEIITRDGSTSQQSDSDNIYKPKVSTWGVFERPANISQAYGGGRIIKPGEALETEEQKKAREERTKQLLAAYYKKIGLNVDPELKKFCEKTLKLGNESLDRGEIQSASQYFEQVMEKMPYQSELHGLAALKWAVCLDSTSRYQEAQAMYEKIVSHPNVSVRRQAKQLLFGFKAMDALKLSTKIDWDGTLYERYFNSFTDGYNNLYKSNQDETSDEDMNMQVVGYIGFLLFPLVLLFSIILLRGR